MKKVLLSLVAAAAMTATASAADLPARTYTKAPPPIVAPSWTGFYIFGGGGGGLWAGDQHTQTTVGGIPLAIDQRDGGSGWFGTVGAGYDWQINHSWVFGVLADGQFGSIRGTIHDTAVGLTGFEKVEDSLGCWRAPRLPSGSERPVLCERGLLGRSLLGYDHAQHRQRWSERYSH